MNIIRFLTHPPIHAHKHKHIDMHQIARTHLFVNPDRKIFAFAKIEPNEITPKIKC